MSHDNYPGRELPKYEKHFNALAGLAPQLVKDLAILYGQDPRDINVTLPLMPYGDRATLGAYGYFVDAKATVVSPDFTELIAAAHDVVLKAVRPEDIARITSAGADDL